jgi:predicted Zn-dependent protease
MWADIGEVNLQVGAPEAAAECARRALRCAPDHKKTRMFCCAALCAAGLYEEAEPHIRWCLQRSPGDTTLQSLAQKSAEARHAGKVHVAAGPAATLR